jgi:serine/threonine-protein kinase
MNEDARLRYQILAELGRGGMGVVYKARDVKLDRIVALKRLLTKDNRLFIDRFMKEAKSIAAMNHPNIIQIFDIGEDGEGFFITTEFVEGTDLSKLIAKQKQLPPKSALRVFVPVCRAMQYAHEKGVIHRDIKPANILLTADGTPKIADFGLARLESEKDLEKTGIIMGTQFYASPEQFTDTKHVDHRTDIYSLGAMFYEMITGFSPRYFRESEIPQLVRAIVLKAMENERDKRYQSVKALLEDLNAIWQAVQSAPTMAPAPAAPPTVLREAPPAVLAADDGEMILVPAGPFRFGPDNRVINLPAFYIDKYPVTNRAYARVVPGHVFPPAEANHPVTKISWLEANAYARKLGKRLPEEAEWEKAARGADGRQYPWGNVFNPNCGNTFESHIGTTTPVDAYPEGKSPYGVCDLAGNVWEWTNTYLDERHVARVLKGGAFNGEAKFALCHARFAYPEKGVFPAAGFRCVRNA